MSDNLGFMLEEIFKTEFLASAPLYVAAKKIKIPYEDTKYETILYRGSLKEESRPVHQIADYELLKTLSVETETNNLETVATESIRNLARSAGVAVDGLIRLENVKSIKEADPRQTNNLVVTDVFEHGDGRRNLQVIFHDANKLDWNPADPFRQVRAWTAYRFWFAAAAIKMEYKQ